MKCVRCFHCQHVSLGEISAKHYYCQECCLEFKVSNNQWFGYRIDEEGDLHLEVSSEANLETVGASQKKTD